MSVDADKPEVTIDLKGCARCLGEGHTQLTFKKLSTPMKVKTVTLTHWASCPTNGEPIMLGFV